MNRVKSLLISAAIFTNLYSFKALCYSNNNQRTTSESTEQKYKYFDLFNLQGIDPCDSDSGVIVTGQPNLIKIEIHYPHEYSLTLKKKSGYWYAHAEFDMNKNKYDLGKSESWPRKYDRFIFNDTILDYEQMIYEDEIIKTLYIKTQDTYKSLELPVGNDIDSDPQKILTRILKILQNSMDLKFQSELVIKRYGDRMEYIGTKYGKTYLGSFPETYIWGGAYGLGSFEIVK